MGIQEAPQGTVQHITRLLLQRITRREQKEVKVKTAEQHAEDLQRRHPR